MNVRRFMCEVPLTKDGRDWQSLDRLAKSQGNERATRPAAGQFIDPDGVPAFSAQRAQSALCLMLVHRRAQMHGFDAPA
jgi:hypothetical protein